MKTHGTISFGMALGASLVFSAIGQQRITSFDDALRAHGIDTSKTSLFEVLRNSNPRIRSLGALELAEIRPTQAVPAIESALAAELDPEARIDMATSLLSMGDPVGATQLEAICTDRTLTVQDRISAIQQLRLAEVGHPEIASTKNCGAIFLEDIERPGLSSDSLKTSDLLNAVRPLYRDLPEAQALRLKADVQGFLGDKSPSVRMSASDALGFMHSDSSAGALRAAIAREQNDTVRSAMQSALNVLLKTK